MLGRLLVHLGRVVVRGLVDLVTKSVLGGREAGAGADIAVLGDLCGFSWSARRCCGRRVLSS